MFGERAYQQGKIAVFKTCIDAGKYAFDEKSRERKRKELGVEDKMVIGFIGRYMPQKNPLFLIDIFNEITKIEPRAVLVTVGYGDLADTMHEKIDTLGLTEKVIDLGKTEDIIPLYNAFDAFLLPSLYEGLPIVGFEAQNAGLPTFFSTEVTEEASACSLAHFLPLSNGAKAWAENIVEAVRSNIPQRTSHHADVVKAGNDSVAEAQRLADYYDKALRDNHL